MYIVIEGLDFSGKSTLAKKLSEYYLAHLVTEPFRASTNCQMISSLLESPHLGRLYKTQLYIASRTELFLRLKEQKHHFIISDRNFISNMVYQGKDNPSMQQILDLNISTLTHYGVDPIPDIIIHIDVPYAVAFERFRARASVSEYDKMIINKSRYEILRQRYHRAIDMVQYQFDHHTQVIRIDDKTGFDTLVKRLDNMIKN